MAFHPSSSSYPSTPRRGRCSRQTQTYRNPISNQPHLNETGEALPSNPKLQGSSLLRPRGTSINLLSRICKFEGLDALSLPIKFPSLRPAHLKVYRNSSSRREATASQTRRLSTIFSPCTENHEQTFLSEDDFTSGRDTLGSNKSRTWLPPSKKSSSRKLQKSQVSYQSNSIRMSGGIWDLADASESKRIGVAPAPYIQKEAPKKKTIREMIKFYDGSMDTFLSNAASAGNNTHARPSVLNTTQVTPVLRKRPSDFKPPSGTSTASSGRKLATRQSAAPVTPTKFCQSFVASQRQPFIGLHTPYSTIQSNPSPSKSSISKVSPGTTIRSKGRKNCGDARSEQSPTRAIPNRHSAGSNRKEAPSSGPKRQVSVSDVRGRTLVGTAGKENPMPNLDRRKISDKIEELYHAKSLERNHETLREIVTPRDVATAGSRTVAQGDVPQQTDFRSEFGRTQSTVADMRKKFEGGAAPKAPISVVPSTLSVHVFSKTSPFSKERVALSEISVPPPPPPVFVPSSDTKRKSNISPKTVQEAPTVDGKKGKTMLTNQEVPLPIITTRKETNRTSSNIRDRIKLFESIQGTGKRECEKRKSSYTRRIRTSMKNLFEPTSRKSDEDSGVVGLSSNDVKDVIDEFQDTGATPKFGKRSTLVARWNNFPQVPPSSGTDGTMSEEGSGSPCTDGVKDMIVKEAECGLKQPRPVRITEMKRMVLLCRERGGGIMDKERSRIVQSRKL